MVYYFISSDVHQCYDGVTLGIIYVIKGIQILACIYPLYQLMMFLLLMVLVAQHQNIVLRLMIIIAFTIVLTSFGFGGLGVVFSCMVHT